MPERDRAPMPALDQRLRVRPVGRAGGRVARVADRGVAVQAAELLLVENLRDEAHVAQHRQPAVVGDRDPGRLLAAVLQREEAEEGRRARRRARVRGCRRRRTSGDRPELAQVRPVGLARRQGSPSRSAPRRPPRSRAAEAATPRASACARPPAPTSWASESFETLRQSQPISSTSSPSASQTRVARPPAARHLAHVRHEPDAPDDGRRRNRPSVGLVVKRHVARDDRNPERLRRLARSPSIASASSQPISGFSGLPKLRQSVSASGSPPAQATLRAAPSTAARPASRGSRQPSGGPSSETASPRHDGRSCSTAASSPGRRTVRERTSWSYCS